MNDFLSFMRNTMAQQGGGSPMPQPAPTPVPGGMPQPMPTPTTGGGGSEFELLLALLAMAADRRNERFSHEVRPGFDSGAEYGPSRMAVPDSLGGLFGNQGFDPPSSANPAAQPGVRRKRGY